MSEQNHVQGTVLVVGAAFVFALVALVVKKDPLPVLMATECRFLVSWVIAIAFMLKFRVSRGLWWFAPPDQRFWVFVKCTLSFAFIILWWTALRYAPVGDCIAVIYSSPIFTVLFSRIFLKEPLSSWFPFQALLVTLGTIFVLNPPFIERYFVTSTSSLEARADYTFVFLALVAGIPLPIVTKKAKDCSWIEVEHVSACIASILLTPGLAFGQYILYGTCPTLPVAATAEITLICLAAVGSFVGIAMQTKGYQMADVGKASMFNYLEIPFAFVLQHFGTDEPVRMQAVCGSILIVASCFLGDSRLGARKSADEKSQVLLDA